MNLEGLIDLIAYVTGKLQMNNFLFNNTNELIGTELVGSEICHEMHLCEFA